jgi:hypothetical protein
MSSQYRRGQTLRTDTVTAITGTPQTSASIGIGGYNTLTLDVNYTRVAGTAVVFTFDVSDDGGTTWHEYTSVTTVAGTGTRVQYTDSTTTSVSKKFAVQLEKLNHEFIRYNVGATSGTTDSALITVVLGYLA